MTKLKIVLILCLFSFPVFAEKKATFSDLKEAARPYLLKIIGKEYTVKLLGEAPKVLKLPPIPKITEDARSTKSVVADEINDEKIKKDNEKYDYFFVEEVFKAVRNEEASKAEIAQWMNALKQGASRDGLYRSIVLGQTYRQMENFKNSPTDEAVDFTVLMLNKYLALEADKAALQNLNVFSLKRIIVEKCLELIDVFASKSKEDLGSWYGVLSAELAEKYGSIWKNKLRQEKSPFKHKGWAQKVPLQHIKSEVIIKLHTVFNNFK